MNAAFEMSIWLVISTIFLVQLQFDTINSISTAYHHSESGRKLFGGYRIVPRPCTASTDGKRSEPKTGVCMFNYECNQSGGEMIGSCIDGFLFGVCCSLPQSMNHIQIENDNVNHFGSFFNTLSTSSPSPSPSPSGSLPSLPSLSSLTSSLNKRPGLTNNKIKVDGISTTKMPPTHSVPVRRPILEHYFGNQTHGGFIDNEGFLPLHAYPVADTILLNPDGTLVDDDKNPEKIFTPQHPHQSYSPSRPTPPTLNHHSQSHLNYGYVVGGDFYTMNTMNTMNKQPPNKVQSPISAVTQGVDMTVSNVHQITTKLTSDQLSGRPTQPQGIYSYVTQRPTHHSQQQNPLGSSSSQNSQTHLSSQNSQTHMGSQSSQSYLGPQSSQSHLGPQSTQSYLGSQSPQSQSHLGSQSPQGSSPVTFVRYPSPGMYTTASMFNKKTDMLPLPSTTSRPNPSYVIADDNLILLQTFTSQNKIKHPTTRIPTESTQVTRKSSNKPVHVTTKMPVKTTTSSYDLDDKYSSYNYNFYTGSSKPPILISHPVGLDDNGQAISHILGILNTTEPDPETVTQTSNSDGALSTWVSILGDEKPLKNKNPKPSPTKPTPTKTSPTKPSPTKPASTATTYVHGPSYTVTSGDTKPAPTVLVIHDVAGTHGPTTKPTKRPVSGVVSHSTNKITIKNPNKPSPTPKPKPTKPTKPTHFEETEVYHTGQENLVNFPPVRNPEILNASGLNQMEKPTLVHTYVSGQDEVLHLPNGITLDVVPDNVDLNTIDTEEEDYDDITTPSLQEDKVEGQVHVFVEKIVNSLSGNFQDLEQLLFKNENKSSITNPNGIQLNNIYVGEDIDRITTEDYTTIITSTRKPSRRPTTIKPDFYDTTIQETSVSQPQKRPKPTTKKPLTTYETTLPGIIIKRPTTSATPTRKPSTSNATKRPTLGVTTKKPSAASSVVTKRPSPSIITASKKPTTLATTRRPSNTVTTTATSTSRRPSTRPKPKPTVTTRRTTTTTEVTDLVPESDEITEQLADTSTPDFRKECGVRPLVKRGGKIVGGKGSQFGYYPWQVLVRESTWLGLFTKNKCGGVLITNRYVITAAHCQPGFLASLVAVFGEYDISGELESRRSVAKNVRRVIVHRQYDPATFENDLALLELDSPIAYDEHIVPICMPRDGEDYVGRMATVTGWGRLKYGGGVPSVLQEVRVPLIENSVCQEMFQTAGHQKRIISSFLCAGYANGQKDSCEGDSGGPLMVEREDGRWVLLGTVSHGIKCAAPYLPGVYMRTTYYKPWLKSITGVST